MKFTTSRRVDRPVSEVFAVFSDLSRAAERIRGIERLELLTPGPVGVGTRFRETRIMFKREETVEMTILAFEPDRRYVVGCSSCGCVYETEFRFTPESAQATRVEVEMRTRALTFFAKLMKPLGKLMSGTFLKCFEKDLDDLQAVVEQRGQPARA